MKMATTRRGREGGDRHVGCLHFEILRQGRGERVFVHRVHGDAPQGERRLDGEGHLGDGDVRHVDTECLRERLLEGIFLCSSDLLQALQGDGGGDAGLIGSDLFISRISGCVIICLRQSRVRLFVQLKICAPLNEVCPLSRVVQKNLVVSEGRSVTDSFGAKRRMDDGRMKHESQPPSPPPLSLPLPSPRERPRRRGASPRRSRPWPRRRWRSAAWRQGTLHFLKGTLETIFLIRSSKQLENVRLSVYVHTFRSAAHQTIKRW